MKLPAIMFYTGDWLKDPSLRSVSVAARGLWMDMLCLMSEASPRGFLKLNGKPVTPDQLARMTGGSAEDVSRLIQELGTAGVYSTDRHGVIYSRRIVRDEETRQRAREHGKRGGNPKLAAPRQLDGDNPPLIPSLKGGDKPNPTPSYSSSDSVSKEDKPAAAGTLPPSGFRRFTEHFVRQYGERYGVKYPWKKADGPIAANIFKGCEQDADRAVAVADRYLGCEDEFYHGHPLGKLLSQLPTFLVPARTKGKKGPGVPLTKQEFLKDEYAGG